MQHSYLTSGECGCNKEGYCNICDGGLALCKVCGGAEGSLPSHCPGYKVHPDVLDAVYSGSIDFKDGLWVVKPSVHSPKGIAAWQEQQECLGSKAPYNLNG